MNMTRRTAYKSLAACCLLVLAIVLLLFFTTGQRMVTVDELLRAEPGLTEAQVEELFGGPGRQVEFRDAPGNPDQQLIVLPFPGNHYVKTELVRDPTVTWRMWPGDDVRYIVIFKDGKVMERFGAGYPGLLERLRGWSKRHFGL